MNSREAFEKWWKQVVLDCEEEGISIDHARRVEEMK